MPVEAIATYRPPWRDSDGHCVAGADEDTITMAVAALGALLDGTPSQPIRRVVIVTRTPALLEGPIAAIISAAVGLDDDVPVENHLGGAPSALDVLAGASPGTVVVGIDPAAPAAAAAALVSRSGATLERCGRAEGRLPARVRQPGAEPLVCDDPRLLRDLGWRLGMARLGADPDGRRVVVGPPPSVAEALGGERVVTELVAATGAAAPLLALAELAAGAGAPLRADGDLGDVVTIAALEGGTVSAVAVTGAAGLRVVRDEPTPVPLANGPGPAGSRTLIPASAAAYARAFDAKIRLAGGRCECGALDFPPRYHCLACGRDDASTLERLPRTGTVYTAVTIHVPVPGRVTPYSLVVVDLDGAGVRHLAPVTGARPGSVAIGDPGRLVLRRIADREIGPDYSWAFLPGANGVSEAA